MALHPATDTSGLEELRPRRRKLQQKEWAPYVFLAPSLFFLVVFFLLPVGFSLYLTFTKWNPLSNPQWIGFENYQYLFTRDPNFYNTLKNTFVYAFGSVFIGVPIALVLAFLFTLSRWRALWRSIYWLPMVTNIVAIAYIWAYLLDGTYGLFNKVLLWFGIVGPQWLKSADVAMIAVIIVTIWTGLGHNMLVFSAGLEGIDESFYEAARIDGANNNQIFWSVTLPLLRPTLLLVTITSFIGATGSFGLILVLTLGGPAQSTNVTALYLYQMAFQDLRMGRASALAFILFVIIFLMTLVQLRIFRRGGVEAY
jgi:multiple sugar transport system permease protein